MAAVILLVLGLALSPLAERHRVFLSERHRVFLEDEAHFLLTADERARFVALETHELRDELRDRFIEAFWSYRDRAEHHDRLRACERLFGRQGLWSERGRVYQLLGAPSFREDFTRAGHRILPSELWHYTGVDVSFLPDSFYLVFFRRGGFGEHRLWNPATDGVEALVAAAEPSAFELGADPGLEAVDPALALAVEGLVPGGGRREAVSLLASLDAFPELRERDRVFGETVRVAVSTREFRSRLVTLVFADDAGVRELHYALELAPGASRYLRWRAEGERYRVRFTLVGRLVGVAIERERWEDSIELDVSASERQALTTTRLSFRGRRIVQPNDERFELALVTDGAGAVVTALIDNTWNTWNTWHPWTVDDNEARARAFESELGAAPEPARVLVRARTRAEEGRYRFARGLAFAERGARARAIEELEAALELNGDEVRVHLELARLLYASRRYRDVLTLLGATERPFADEVDVWVMMAGSAEALGQMGDAVAYYDRALALAPGNVALAQARARAELRLQELQGLQGLPEMP